MIIAGEWRVRDDGIPRPLLRAKVQAADGTLISDDFLIDIGADRTVFSAALFGKLGLVGSTRPQGEWLTGVGGPTASVLRRSLS